MKPVQPVHVFRERLGCRKCGAVQAVAIPGPWAHYHQVTRRWWQTCPTHELEPQYRAGEPAAEPTRTRRKVG